MSRLWQSWRLVKLESSITKEQYWIARFILSCKFWTSNVKVEFWRGYNAIENNIGKIENCCRCLSGWFPYFFFTKKPACTSFSPFSFFFYSLSLSFSTVFCNFRTYVITTWPSCAFSVNSQLLCFLAGYVTDVWCSGKLFRKVFNGMAILYSVYNPMMAHNGSCRYVYMLYKHVLVTLVSANMCVRTRVAANVCKMSCCKCVCVWYELLQMCV